MSSLFWLVWSPEGKCPPRYQHETKLAAEREATRLAQHHPETAFYALEVTGMAFRKTGEYLARFSEAIDLSGPILRKEEE